MSQSLEARLRRLEDRAELGELITRYAIAVDDRDFSSLAQMFTLDCVFDNVLGVEQGRAKVIDYYRKRLGEFGPTYHIPHRQSIDFLNADEAQGTVLAHAELAIDGHTLMVALRYGDHYQREEGRWRFRERKVRQLYALPLEDLPTGLAEDLRKRWPGTAPAPADLPPPGVI